MVSAEIARSKRRAARAGLALAVVGGTAQVVGYLAGVGDDLGFTALVYAGVLVAAAGAVLAWASIVGGGPRALALAAIVVAFAPVAALLVATAVA